jgi:type II secretory ATPase GspE/PulE/Tfp pilus assembly ATPase PilB-like protein
VFEVLSVTDSVRRLLMEKAGRTTLARETAERITLREAAVRSALAGETTVEEALRVDESI